MLERDPSKRITIDELLECKWATKNNTEIIKIDEIQDISSPNSFGNLARLIYSNRKKLGNSTRDCYS